MFALGLEPPYYAVIFVSSMKDEAGYGTMAAAMGALAAKQPGYLGVESTRGEDGFGITVSYWESEEAILAWKHNAAHAAAQDRGIQQFYEHYELRVARVDRAYSGPSGRGSSANSAPDLLGRS